MIVGLTGGVGSGKSTVAGVFTLYGTSLIDADQVAREVVAPKTPGLDAVVERFGSQYLSRSGELDRTALAKTVFSDINALNDLNAIVHPLVRAAITDQLDKLRDETPDGVVILMVPLLLESGAYPTDCIIVVDCDPEVAVARLVRTRDWTIVEAKARMAAQFSREQRLAAADYVIDNSGTREDINEEVAKAWEWLTSR
jgi:dephospho-CoA kinase